MYIIKICGLSFSGYNILQILLKEKITNNKNILKYYKNKFSLNNNIEMENNTDSDSDDYEEFINKVDQIKSNTYDKQEKSDMQKKPEKSDMYENTEINKKNQKQENLDNEEKNEEKNQNDKDDIFIKRKKKVRKMVDPERQMEDLDNLFRKKIMGKLSSEEEKVKIYKDDL